MQQTIHRHSSRSGLYRLSAVFAALALLFLLPASLRAQSNSMQDNQMQSMPPPPTPDAVSQRTVRLSDVKGDVKVYRGDLLAFPQAFMNMPIVAGMRLVTGDSGRAEIQFDDGSVARLAPNSSLLIASLGSTPKGVLTTQIDALSGLTYYEFNTEDSQYTLNVGPETVIPQNNAVIRVDMDNVPYRVADMQGTLQLLSGSEILTNLASGDSVSFDPSNPGGYQVSDSIPPNSWDQWNANRDAELAELASGGGQNASSDDSAWNELNYYGDWYNVPGYGEGWAPSGVGENWDPYGSGWWGYYPSWGYTWISGYPWGWWPYHCGDWNWFGGYGWVWFPGGGCGWGGYGGGWYPVAPIRTAPSNYHPVVRPARTAHAPKHRVPPIYAVHRGGHDTHFRRVGGTKPAPRTFNVAGQNLNPVRPSLPAMQFAPVGGEGYTVTAASAHPGGAANRVGHSTPVVRAPYRVGLSNPDRGGMHSGGNSGAGSHPIHAPFFHPGNNGGNRTFTPPSHPAPVFHPAPMPHPAPVFHPAPMPHPSFHPAPMPSFHPAPMPHSAGRPH